MTCGENGRLLGQPSAGGATASSPYIPPAFPGPASPPAHGQSVWEILEVAGHCLDSPSLCRLVPAVSCTSGQRI